MTPENEVLILLATFNAGPFLQDLLRSLEDQTLDSWRLLASDDGSTDGTVAEMQAFSQKHPGRVELLDLPPSGSAQANFFRLLRLAPPAPYYAFCDQDDVWAKPKLERLILEMRKLEQELGSGVPCLVYSDLTVVDSDLRTIASSFTREISVDPATVSLGSTLVENSIPGCSMLLNRAIVDEFRRYEGDLSDARMHDWWLALIAFSMGAVRFVPEQLVLYRQHAQNSAGSVRRRGAGFAYRKLFKSGRGEVIANMRQGKLFAEAYSTRIIGARRAQVEAFGRFDQMGKLSRVAACVRHDILKQGPRRRIYQLIKI